METSRERDQAVDQLLRQSLRTTPLGEVTDSCLDAETLAAWVDGTLPRVALEGAEVHVADCARCQSLLAAMARTDAAVAHPEPERAGRRWLGWLVPLTAAAAAAVLWIAVPRQTSAPLAPVTDIQERAADTNTQAPTATQQSAAPSEPAPARERAAFDDRLQAPPPAKADQQEPPAQGAVGQLAARAPAEELRRDTASLEDQSARRENAAAAPAAPPPSAPAAGQPAPTLRTFGTLAETVTLTAVPLEIRSPDPSVRWRITGSIVERSTDAGANWVAVPIGVQAVLTAGASPSTSVLWVVGRGGVVLLTVDGRSWRRLPFPETTDLSSVRAMDAQTASVTTADGRIFNTADGGVTWTRP